MVSAILRKACGRSYPGCSWFSKCGLPVGLMIVVLLAAGAACTPAWAAVYRVDAASAAATPDGAAWETAFKDIQSAVNAASTAGGGEVWVAEGVYTATTDIVVTMKADVHLYGGFAGTESAREGRDWTSRATVIDGEDTRRCVVGASDATLDGFTVTRGKSADGSGMYNYSSSPMVTNCTFTQNTAVYGGGGMYNYSSSPTVTNCTFAWNTAPHRGGGMYNSSSSPTVTNCTFTQNKAFSYGGGGMYNSASSPTVTNCTFSQNKALSYGGGGMYNSASSPTVTNCTFSQNKALSYGGGGMYNSSSSPTVTNCILWDDTPGEIYGGTPAVTYSCIDGGYAGEGNIDANPLLWNTAEGDFRLHPSSPCVDSGTSTGAPGVDMRGVARPQGAGVDRGAYEMYEPDTDGDGLMDEFETLYSDTDPNDVDSDDDGVNDWDAWFSFRVWYVDVASTAAAPDGLSWATAFPDIQPAVDSAHVRGGGEVWVAAGTYAGAGDSVVVMRSNVHLYGGFAGTESAREERDWANRATVIDGEDKCRCVVGASDATLDGFTATRGRNSSGGGGMYNYSCSPTVTNCTFIANSAGYDYYYEYISQGGGMYNGESSPMVTNCTFAANMAYEGGGMYNYNCSPAVTNCTFAANTAYEGGGMYNGESSPTLTSCTLAANTAYEGGGMYNEESSPAVTNCTLTANTASYGGGMLNSSSSPVVTNCILWDDTGGEIPDGAPVVTYSCIEGGYTGEGNLDANPMFWSAPEGDFRLHPSSPCVDSGTSTGAPSTDIRGVARPQGAGVDRGAYEMDEPDTDGDGLMDGFETLYSGTDPNEADSDDDGVSDWDAWFSFRVWYVDAASTAVEPDGLSWATAFPDIQSAVDSADVRDGGEIWVAEGTYTGAGTSAVVMQANIHLYGGFAGTESAREERDWANRATVIDGETLRRCVVGASDATLDGFTLTRGRSEDGGGMYNFSSSPTVTNCTFTLNWAYSDGGGMYNFSSSPIVTNCTFTQNLVYPEEGQKGDSVSSPAERKYAFTTTKGYADGGGMCNSLSSPTVTACTFALNTAYCGAGMCNYSSSPTVTNCMFTKNTAYAEGGGMRNYSSSPTVMNCTFIQNTGESGGGMYGVSSSSPMGMNSTSAQNVGEAVEGIHKPSSSLTVTNCIFWGNMGGEIYGIAPTVTYSCVQGGYAGEGNIDANPLFWNAGEGDFRLHATSPCVDSGTSTNAPSADMRGVARPQGAGVDRGAYEMNEPDTDGDGLMDEFERVYSGTDPNDADSDDDGMNDWDSWFGSQIWYVDASSRRFGADGLSWATAFLDVQSAVDGAHVWGGGEIWVAAGTYTGTGDNVVVMRYNVHLYGGFAGTESAREERDWANQATVIDGEDARRCVVGASNATLDGFTVTRGSSSWDGGGMYNSSSSPTVTNCMFVGNTAYGGGGMYNSSSAPTLTNCTFTANTAHESGGGMCNSSSSPIVTNCTFAANTAATYGDVAYGGGMCNSSSSSPMLMNCMFTANTATHGGGMYNRDSSPTVMNCIFAQNLVFCYGEGGVGAGMCNFSSSPTVTNCTFAQNVAEQGGGGMYNSFSSPTVTNCILWDDTSGEIYGDTPTVTYSCIDGGYAGEGNLDANPLFWNAMEDDFRLHASSPCLDSGTSAGAPGADLRGVARPQGAGVDRGAYEMDEPDSDGDGLMDEFETTYSGTDPNDADSDNDGVSDWDAWFSFGVWYVDAASTAAEPDGLSWATAFPDIQSAVDSADVRGGGEVWVAGGTYTGAGVNVVVMRYNVHLYGGFAGTESAREERDWANQKTVIDGENARRCVNGANNATLDGFTVWGGRSLHGGGMCNTSSSPTVTNCTFAQNTAAYGEYTGAGGGMCNVDSSSPTVANCTFTQNTASSYGGGMYNYASSPTVMNCTFAANTTDSYGGGMYNWSSSPAVANCTFTQNMTYAVGSGMYNYDSASSPTVTNCILWGDTVGEISGGTPTVTYSCVEGGYAGEGNLDADPLLGPLADEGGPVQTCPIGALSSARDTGVRCFLDTDGTFFYAVSGALSYATLDGAPYVPDSIENELTATDARGVARPEGPRVDMGAYELVTEDEPHAADINKDWHISAMEISRVIAFYNAGAYHVDGSTSDGYGPGPGSHDGPPHDSDYDPQDWTISVTELGRLVTFYNAGGYKVTSGTADGFAPAIKGE